MKSIGGIIQTSIRGMFLEDERNISCLNLFITGMEGTNSGTVAENERTLGIDFSIQIIKEAASLFRVYGGQDSI